VSSDGGRWQRCDGERRRQLHAMDAALSVDSGIMCGIIENFRSIFLLIED
jgi:hypothetical protein